MTDTPRRHRRSGLFAPFIILGMVLAAWTGWWFYLSSQVRDRLETQAQALRSQGWQITHGDLGLGGWPFRVRVAAPDLSITAPSGHAIAAPEMVAQAEAWNPTKWVLVATDGLTVTRAAKGKVAIKGVALRASVHGLTQRWPNFAIDLTRPEFTALPGAEPFPISRAASVQFYLRPHVAPAGAPGADTSVDMLFRLVDADGRPDGPVEGMAQRGRLSAQIETVIERADALKGSDAAGLLAAWSQGGGRFSDVRGEISAGDSRARLSSELLRADADGRLVGQMSLSAVRPLPAIAGLARTGPSARDRIGAAGAAAATAVAPRQDEAINLTLVFRDGRTFLGPFAMAPAPKLF